MDLRDVIRRRRMVRAFEPQRPVPPDLLDELLALAQRAPSAGYSQGFEFLVLDGPDDLATFWDVTGSREFWTGRFAGVLDAPVVVVPLAHKGAYLERYSEPDKAPAGLQSEEAWPVPYWLTDTAMATMLLLLGAVDAGLGALFFGIFRNERLMLDAFGVPADRSAIGAVALGYAADAGQSGSAATRPRRPLDEVVHRGRWHGRSATTS